MFSGIVEHIARVISLESSRLCLEVPPLWGDTSVGDSISVSGACLTVTKRESVHLWFDVSPETFRKTTLSNVRAGDSINVERSLMVGERVHGHFVAGHVDTVVRLKDRNDEGNSIHLTFGQDEMLRAFIVPKGSIALAGVSLTIGEVFEDRFTVYVVPHTAQVTTLGSLKPSDTVNLEVDMLARYVEGCLMAREGAK